MEKKIRMGIAQIVLCLTLMGCANVPTAAEIPTVQVPPLLVTDTATSAAATDNGQAEPSPKAESTEPLPTPTEELLDVTSFPDPRLFRWAPFADSLSEPVGMAAIDLEGSSILYILEQDGVIRVIQDSVLLDTPFLDIDNRVGSTASEQGLLGIALDPNYMQNREFYLNYTNNSGDTHIARYVANPDYLSAESGSEEVILTVDQPFANHNGGHLDFGPDGFLYIGLGDGGSGGDPDERAQNLNTLLGKMLRIAVTGQDTYATPSDNPFAGGGGLAEIWAFGLRNPWRYSFDSQSGGLFIADVGQNQWEEINYLPLGAAPGQNFGWDYREGGHPFEGSPPSGLVLIDPIAEYDHSRGCSVTGGYVYRGPTLAEWQGVYVFGDYCSGRVWGLLPGEGEQWRIQELYDTDFRISAFGKDAAGELYLIDHGGSIYKLESSGMALGYLPLILN